MKLNNYLQTINEKNKIKSYKEDICLSGVGEIIELIYQDLKKQENREVIKLLKNIDINYQTLYSWKTNYNPIALSKLNNLLLFWKEECKKSQEEINFIWNRLYLENKGYSQNSQKRVILPTELDDELGYLIGFFQGDGHLKKDNKLIQENSIYFYEKGIEMINKINQMFEETFSIKGNVYLGKNEHGRWYVLRICAKPIYLFFRDVLKLKAGRKTRNVEVPEIIKKSEESVQLSFIRGFFDAEGGVGETKKNPWLEIGQASKEKPCEILIWIKDKLEKRGIILSEPKRTKNQEYFRIRTAKRESIKRFFEIISTYHPEKVIKFKKIIKNG